MGVDSKHPLYIESADDWEQMRDTFDGQRSVKEKASRYLPMTSGMEADGGKSNANTAGAKAYRAYLGRAVFPEIVRETVESMLGVMHNKPPSIEVPKSMEPMLEKATLRGESIEMLLRRINEEQLIAGRLGLLLEVPNGTGIVLPHIALYRAEDIINWDEGTSDETQVNSLNLVVIDESDDERKANFEWEHVDKYRVMVLGAVDENEAQGEGTYRVGVFRDDNQFSEAELTEPVLSGTSLNKIPFVFVNTKDVVPTPDNPPLLGQANLALTIYRGEADYRQALFMQGQDTLVTIGSTGNDGEELRVGAGASLDLPMGGDAKFIGPDSQGLPEMRTALENDYTRGEKKANGLLEAVSRAAESGEALRVRVSARTASLNQIAMAGAFALQEILRMAAEWLGANPDEVIVTPNLDFVADRLPGNELTGYMTAKGLGAPVALETIHEQMQERGLTTLSWEEEKERLTAEAEEGLAGAVMPGESDPGATAAGSPETDAAATAADQKDANDQTGNSSNSNGGK